ncbi:MAG: MarR family transcriptional regulator [Inquilinus limosus]|uniref:MarR family transcriptional regulator n=1 Tax=Inquilinus limosus TaxID=171674 RepID=A0A952FVH9_9PROT|nr:MarR family transcriptional regulator [Inquilinus limosus]
MASTDPAPSGASGILAEAMRPALARLYRRLRRETQDGDIPPLQNLLLVLIIKSPGIGVGALAEIEGLRGPTVSGHVKQLETAGLVARTPPDPQDRRRTGLIATAEGVRRADALRRQRTDWLARRLDLLSPAERQAIEAAIPALVRLGE